jgi:alkylation response protein AidB-like acyl-CoA dehydrogenase
MDLLPSPEQDEIVAAVAGLLSAELPTPRPSDGQTMPPPLDRALWARCAGLGWFGLGLDPAAGGVGYGLVEEALVFREIGRYLAPGPFLPTVLGARVAAAAAVAGHVAGATDLAGAIVDGTTVVGLADLRHGRCTTDEVDGDLDLHDCAEADLALVVTPDGAALVEVTALEVGEPVGCLDPATTLATARATHVRPLASATSAVEPIFRRGAVLVAALLTGVAEAARDMGAEHARTRVQFGRPIGVHQAVKHACTDMAVRAEAAGCQTFLAAMTLDGGLADAAFQVASAKVVATDAALRNARANIQVHGGMGFTWEHGAHRLLKRAHVLGWLFGDRSHHLADLIALPAAH